MSPKRYSSKLYYCSDRLPRLRHGKMEVFRFTRQTSLRVHAGGGDGRRESWNSMTTGN